MTAAGAGYLGDGSESSSYSFDGDKLTPAEQQPQATPTTVVPGDIPAFPGTSAPGATTDPSAGGASGSRGQGIARDGQSRPAGLALGRRLAAERLLLERHARGGGGRRHRHHRAAPGAVKGATVDPGAGHERLRRRRHDLDRRGAQRRHAARSRLLDPARSRSEQRRRCAHPIGDTVVLAGGSLRYVDAELAQDLCTARPAQRLGISSEPSLTSAQSPFATGLSSTGRLTSAAHTSKFYGSPLIAWTPAFNADIYEVQYSKTAYPFRPELDPRSKVKGFMTFSTSDVLPLAAERGTTACAASTTTSPPACSR